MEDRRGGSTVGEMIRETREKAGMSQRVLGSKVGVTGSYVSTIEAAGVIPTEETTRKLAVALGLPIEELSKVAARERLRKDIEAFEGPSQLREKLLACFREEMSGDQTRLPPCAGDPVMDTFRALSERDKNVVRELVRLLGNR